MAGSHPVKRHAAGLAAIVVAGFALRAWGLTWGLRNATVTLRPHPDEWPIYWTFRWFAGTSTLNPCPSSHSCFFDWGSGYLYLTYAAHFAVAPILALIPAHTFGPQADMAFVRPVLTGRGVSVAASTITIILTFRLATRAYGPLAGLMAATLISFSALLIQLAHFATPDSTTILFLTATLLVTDIAMDGGDARHFVFAGVLIGLTAGTEYQMALLLLPAAVAWLLSPQRDGRAAVLCCVCAAGAFVASNPYALVDFPQFVAAMEHTVEIRTVDSQAQYGDRWAPYGPVWLYVMRYSLGYGVGAAFTVWMVAGAAWAVLQRHRHDILLLSWIVPYFLLVTFTSAKFLRYSAPLLPPLAVLGGRFAVDLLALARRHGVRRMVAPLLALGVLYSGVYDAAYVGLFSASDPRAVAASWLREHARPGTYVAFEELPDGLVNLPAFVARAGYRPCFTQFQPARLIGSMSFVATDSYSVDEHKDVATATVQAFRAALADDPRYQLVEHVHYVPTFLGIRFPIDGSPHDWRYPSHEIMIYQRLSASHVRSTYCYNGIQQAVAALSAPPDLRS